MQQRQEELLSDPVHLLADDSHDLVERPVPKEKIRVNPGCELADVASPHQKLVAGDFGVRRRFAEGWDEEF